MGGTITAEKGSTQSCTSGVCWNMYRKTDPESGHCCICACGAVEACLSRASAPPSFQPLLPIEFARKTPLKLLLEYSCSFSNSSPSVDVLWSPHNAACLNMPIPYL